MAQTIEYSKLSEDKFERDRMALEDLESWYSDNKKMREHLRGIAVAANEYTRELSTDTETTRKAFNARAIELIEHINVGMSLSGVSGLPFHAFCRKYCLKAYILWRESGDDGVPCDKAGFAIAETEGEK